MSESQKPVDPQAEDSQTNAAQSPLKGNLVALVIGLTVSIIMVLGIEYASMTILNRADPPQALPFLINSKAEDHVPLAMQQTWGEDLVVSYLDPHLGFAHDPTANPIFSVNPGFARYASTANLDRRDIRIFALGGSTTDPLTGLFLDDPEIDPESPYNWPKSLHEKLASRGLDSEVFNGGVAGYSSSQQLLKLIRDVLPYEPDLVIALDGVNEMGFAQSLKSHPMVHDYQKRLLEGLQPGTAPIMPNTVKLLTRGSGSEERKVQGVHLGTLVRTSAAQHWMSNVRMSRAIASEFGFEYISFLQPIAGYGNYRMSPDESRQLDDRGGPYVELLTEFYDEAVKLCAESPDCVDLTGVFDDAQGVYLDPRHQNEKGAELIAEAVESHLIKRKLINH